MDPLLLLVLAAAAVATQESCPSAQWTTGGECCVQCLPGEGVTTPCGRSQTQCTPCIDSETFSQNLSHSERCQPCKQCTGLTRMQSPCMDTNDALCVCNYDYHLEAASGRCVPCTVCAAGQGMYISCDHDRDTVCEDCTADTYSVHESSRDICQPCTVCEDDEYEEASCTPTSDRICRSQNPLPSAMAPSDSSDLTFDLDEEPPPDADPPLDADPPPEPEAPGTEGPELVQRGLSDKLIPVYCSVLAAVLGGLVAFIVFKRWNSCKQNKQGGANSCQPANQSQSPTPATDGDKVHSDSGISVDSQSLQDPQGHTVVTLDEEPCLLLPTREELDTLLLSADNLEDADWSSLASLLGYREDRIQALSREPRPLQALLSDWAGQEHASADALRTALRKIHRDDLAQSLLRGNNKPNAPKPNATSVV